MITSMTFLSPTTGATALTIHNDSGNRRLSQVDGLFGPPGPRDVNSPRPQSDGSIDQSRWLSERVITLTGELWNTSPAAVLTDFQTVTAAFQESLLSSATLTFTKTDSTSYQCQVKLADGVQMSLNDSTNTVQYQATFRAQDPRLYSTTLQTLTLATTPVSGPATVGGVANVYTLGATTNVNLVNNGTAPAPLTVTLTANVALQTGTFVQVNTPTAYSTLAPAGANQILLLGGSTPSSTSIASSKNVIYDTGLRTRTPSDGAAATGALAATTEFPLAYPGTSTVTWTAYSLSSMASTKPACVITWRDAWW